MGTGKCSYGEKRKCDAPAWITVSASSSKRCGVCMLCVRWCGLRRVLRRGQKKRISMRRLRSTRVNSVYRRSHISRGGILSSPVFVHSSFSSSTPFCNKHLWFGRPAMPAALESLLFAHQLKDSRNMARRSRGVTSVLPSRPAALLACQRPARMGVNLNHVGYVLCVLHVCACARMCVFVSMDAHYHQGAPRS